MRLRQAQALDKLGLIHSLHQHKHVFKIWCVWKYQHTTTQRPEKLQRLLLGKKRRVQRAALSRWKAACVAWNRRAAAQYVLACEKASHILRERRQKAMRRVFRQLEPESNRDVFRFKQEIQMLYQELGNAKAQIWKYKRQVLGQFTKDTN